MKFTVWGHVCVEAPGEAWASTGEVLAPGEAWASTSEVLAPGEVWASTDEVLLSGIYRDSYAEALHQREEALNVVRNVESSKTRTVVRKYVGPSVCLTQYRYAFEERTRHRILTAKVLTRATNHYQFRKVFMQYWSVLAAMALNTRLARKSTESRPDAVGLVPGVSRVEPLGVRIGRLRSGPRVV